MAKSFLREITRSDVEEAVDVVLAIERTINTAFSLDMFGLMVVTLLTRPEKAVYVDVDYKVVETTVRGETKNG